MVSLKIVQAHNATLKSLAPGLVAVFVGGTSGISLSTAQALAQHTTSPKIYLIGRSASAAERAITDIKNINPSAQTTFLQSDISQLKNVDTVCNEIKAKESKLNLLFMTPGYVTLKGRDETPEGLDQKFSLHYYARMRFVANLLPLLTAAAQDTSVNANTLSRVVSVLDPHVAVRGGASGSLNYDDLSLKNTFSLQACGVQASLMQDFYLEAMAQRHAQTAFVHAYPSVVGTGAMRDIPLSRVLMFLLRPFMVPLVESGERHLFAATSPRYAPGAVGGGSGSGSGSENEDDIAVGGDGVRGSGCYWLYWNGDAFPFNDKIGKMREQGAVEKVLAHTDEVFQRICVEGGTYP